jgi:hypothetical protein
MQDAKQGSAKNSRLKALLVLAIIIVAAVAGAYYYLSIPRAPPQFAITLTPPYSHAAPGGWAQVLVQIARMPGFNGEVNVSLGNPPGWVTANGLVINSTSINGTLTLRLSNQAQYGSSQLSIVGSSLSGPQQSATLSMKVVTVKPLASQYGSGMVYDTTKSLDSETLAALVSDTNGTLQFSKTTSQLNGLEQGDVIVAPPNSTAVVPKGFLLTVLNTQSSGAGVTVDTRPAAMTEVFQELHFGHTPPGGTTSTTSVQSASPFGPHPEDDVTNLCGSQLTCWTLFNWKVEPDNLPANLGGGATLDAYLVAKAYVYAYGDISCCVSIDFGLLALGHEEAYAGLKGSRGAQLNWPEQNLATITSVTIPILPPVLWIDVNLNLVGQASGILKEDVNANIDQYFNVILGPTYNGGMPSALQSYCSVSSNGFDFCSFHNFQPPKPTLQIGNPTVVGDTIYSNGGSTVTWPIIAIGPQLSADVDGVAGISFTLWAFLWLFTNTGATGAGLSYPCQPNYCPVWDLLFGIGATLDLWLDIHVWKAHFWYNWLPGIAWVIDHADNLPPSTPILAKPPNLDLTNATSIARWSTDWIGAILPYYGATASHCSDEPWPYNCKVDQSQAMDYVEPEGESLSCTWTTKEVGDIGTVGPITAGLGDMGAWGFGGQNVSAPALSQWPKDKITSIVTNGITQLTLSVTCKDAGGVTSPPSNSQVVHVVLPLPSLAIFPIQPPIFQNQQFSAQGSASISTPLVQSFTGLVDLCQTQPQNIEWFVGGNFEADIVDVGEGGWVGAQSSGAGCNPTLTATSPGQTTVTMVLLQTDPQTGNQYIPQSGENPNPNYIQSVTINVQPTPTQPPAGGLSVQITTPSEASNSPPHTPFSNTNVLLQGSVTGGTPPYVVTWQGWWGQGPTTIATGPAASTLSYNWFVCTNGSPWYGRSGTLTVTLSATDSTGKTAQSYSPASISINFNCIVTQAMPPLPLTGGLVTLLTVLFAVTGERLTSRVPTTRRLSGSRRI